MAKNPKIYQRLPGAGGTGLQRVRLWQGPDHILLVASSALGERYKRFYFADIQSIVIRKTAAWLAWIIVLLVIAGALGLCAFEISDAAGRGVIAGAGAVFLVILAIHAALGPTCECRIRTAVQTEEVASLKRVRMAIKVLARIRPLIESAQQAQPAEILASL